MAARGAGLDVIFSTSLSRLDDPDRAAAGRGVTDLRFAIAEQGG
ncbi:MAG TPA: hypothetical protein VNT03_02465 [Baekduia sp.]|nr:hypothetical protein [Baekduia sp.]